MNHTTMPSGSRGCGTRDVRATYLCCGVSSDGTPLEDFIVDPAILWPGEWQRGYKILQRKDGVSDVVIFVGKQYYQRPWDFFMEVKLHGASRKIPPTFPFEVLSPGKSRMIFLHSKAIPKFEYQLDRSAKLKGCTHNSWPPDELRTRDVEPISGWHIDGTRCAFALKDLGYFIGKVSMDGSQASLQRMRFEVKDVSVPYEGMVPLAPQLSEKGRDWDIGAFLAIPITHVEYRQDQNLEVANKAQAAGYEVAVLGY